MSKKDKLASVNHHIQILPDKHFPSPITQGKIYLRPFPYPFKAGMAISNDIDDTSPELFEIIHQFLNSDQKTSLGSGLNLEVGDSFWLYPHDPQVIGLINTTENNYQFRDRVVQLNNAGWLDSLHTFGDFNHESCLTRKKTEDVYEILKELKIKTPVWLNHGNTNNKQNIWGRIVPTYSGDLPESPFYHYDLTKKLGIKYYWWSEVTPFPLSCKSPSKFNIYQRLFEVRRKNVVKKLLGFVDKIRDPRQPFELALPVKLRDGNKIWAFTRYNRHPDGVWGRPGRHTLKYQLTPKYFEQLISWQGYCILYTHFGQPSWERGTSPFDNENLIALKRLAENCRKGDIWLTLTSRLLRYWVTWHHLVWNAVVQGDRYRINIQQIIDPVDGSRQLSVNDLMGITYHTPNPNFTDIYVKNKKMKIEKWPDIYPDGSGFVGFVHPRLEKGLFNKGRSKQ